MIKTIKQLLFIVVLLLFSCATVSCAEFSQVELDYARGFNVEEGNGYYVVTVYRSWGDSVEPESYLLIDRDKPIPLEYKNLHVIKIPVERIVTASMTMLPFIEKLAPQEALVAVGGKRYVYSEKIRNMDLPDVASDAGSGLRLDIEKLLALQPDVVFIYTYTAAEKESVDRLRKLGIPIVIASDYLEETPLGVAEWIKFVSLFLGKEKEAQSFFAEIAESYISLKSLASQSSDRPTVMVNAAIGGTWYVSGGQSWPAHLIRDAGACYLWSEVEKRGSVPIDFEKVVESALNSNFWINTSTWQSLAEGENEDSRYTIFRPFKEERVYNNNARVTSEGANDYYQQGIMRPDLILKDLISIFHPDLLPTHSLYFYRHLEERSFP